MFATKISKVLPSFRLLYVGDNKNAFYIDCGPINEAEKRDIDF